ncbi:HAD-IIB family hydrolase [Sphingomonas montana]|uniref:HAD-IIB family hydrolase n=1 Tax=Sphingomonas montana TaxID=1843236 RepID=UPI00096FFE18|nr:HAD-IIB family hydrolase [Sphingomonas montana]
MKQLIAFDLDGTLAESKQAIDAEMAALLARLTHVATVAVISGGDWPQYESQLIGNLPADTDFARLLAMPTSGTKLYRNDGTGWNQVYADDFSTEERDTILAALDKAIVEAGLQDDPAWGDKIEDRGSQITFSALGQQAPLDAKHAWDPDFAKRKRMQAILEPVLPDFTVRTGGSTSLDITRKGIDKAYGIRRLAEISGIATTDMIFMGDAIYPGGNDYAVRAAGVDSVAIRDVTETKRVIETILFCLTPA